MTAGGALILLTQLITLATAALSLWASIRNGRRLAGNATKDDLAEVHDLVNGKTAKLEKLIAEKGFEAGVKSEKAKK